MDLDQPLATSAGLIDGSLLPLSYLATSFDDDVRTLGVPQMPRAVARALLDAWSHAEASCGPVSNLRTLFDLLFTPIATTLGFRIGVVNWHAQQAEIALTTTRRTHVAALLLPWATSPSAAWRDLVRVGSECDAAWGLVMAPPFLSVVRLGRRPVRRSLDFHLAGTRDAVALRRFWAFVRAESFDPTTPHATIDAFVERGTRFEEQVRADLQRGVARAVGTLAAAVEERPAGNGRGRRQRPRHHHTPSTRDQALTIVYRVLFFLFAESRSLVPLDNPVYDGAYSMSTLCRHAMAGRQRGCWDALAAMTRLARFGCRSETLNAPPFNGRLFSRTSAPSLERRTRRTLRRTSEARDAAVADALTTLASRTTKAGRTAISYRDLGVEQLGAVYEHLLDDVPQHEPLAPGRHSSIRKQTGTFYTPQALAEFLIRRTLSPLTAGATSDTILALRVVDPAMGSGACLVAACRFLAAAYEQALIAEGRAGADDFDEHERANIRRLVAERCVAGVDRNPTAVELARLSFWLTTLARGKPLGFLDHRLRVGDSLVGAWPDDLHRLAPSRTRTGVALPLLAGVDLDDAMTRTAGPLAAMLARRDDSIDAVHAKAALWRRLTAGSSPLDSWRRASSLWCARWFWPDDRSDRPSPAETRALLDAFLRGDRTLTDARIATRRDEIAQIADAARFFHWPLEFPDVFHDARGPLGTTGGFDAVIGNPPWEMVRREGGRAETDARHLLRYVRESGQYPSCAKGHLNLYQAFLERSIALLRPGGRLGLVLPWGVACDDGAAALRTRLLNECAVDTILGLDNARGLFPVHRGLRFVVVTATPGDPTVEIRARFGVTTTRELDALPEREDGTVPSAYPVRFTRRTLRAAGGPLLRIPDARRPGDAEFLVTLAERHPPLGDGWNVSFGRELNATDVRASIGTKGLPVIEGKHLSPFRVTPDPTRRLAPHLAARLLPRAPFERPRLAYRDVSGVTNRQTFIAAIVPPGVVTTHSLLCLASPLSIDKQHFLCALFNSYVLNAVVRMLMGNHVTTTLVEALPIPTWNGDARDRAIAAAAIRLATSEAGDASEARFQGLVARRFGLSRQEFKHVIDGFPLVPAERREAAWWEFDAAG